MHKRVDNGRHEAGLVAEVVADGCLVDAGLGGHVLQGHGLVAAVGEQPLSGRQDLLGRLGQRGQRIFDGERLDGQPSADSRLALAVLGHLSSAGRPHNA